MSELYDATDGWSATPSDEYELPRDLLACGLLEACGSADDLWIWMGTGGSPTPRITKVDGDTTREWIWKETDGTPAWADPATHKAWLQNLPRRPRSDWLKQVNSRIEALQACQRRLVPFGRFMTATQQMWRTIRDAPSPLSRAVAALITYEAPCKSLAVSLIAEPPARRWPVRQLPSREIAESCTFLQHERDAVTNSKE